MSDRCWNTFTEQTDSGNGRCQGLKVTVTSSTSLSPASTSSFKRCHGLKEKLTEMETLLNKLFKPVNPRQSDIDIWTYKDGDVRKWIIADLSHLIDLMGQDGQDAWKKIPDKVDGHHHILKDDAAPSSSRLKKTYSIYLHVPEDNTLCLSGVENMHPKVLVHIYSSKFAVPVIPLKSIGFKDIIIIYIYIHVHSSEFTVSVISLKFIGFKDIPEHCFRNIFRSEMETIRYKSQSPLKFAGCKFNLWGILVTSEKIDVNKQYHKSEQECLPLRNGNGPGITKQTIILMYLNTSILQAVFQTTDCRVHKCEKELKCTTNVKKDVTDSFSTQRKYALCGEGDVCNNSFKPWNDDIVTSQSCGNIRTPGQVGQEMDCNCSEMELSKRLCADSFQQSEAEKVLFDWVCPSQNDMKPNPLKGFDIRELIGFDFHPARVNVWVFPLLNARQRAHFKKVICYEVIRLWTFHPCESPAHDGSWITELAAAGFYSSGEEGEVSCFSCSRWYNNFLAGIPLQNAHEPRCRWREMNKPLYCGTEGIQYAVLIDFIKTFENSDVFRRRSRSHNVSSSSIDNSSTLLTSIVPDSGRYSASSRDINDELPLPRHTFEDSSSSHERGSCDRGPNIVQEASPDSSRLILTSATNQPHRLYSGHASGFQGSMIGDDERDNGDGTEPRTNWDLSGASYPQFASREARNESFRHWDPDHIQKPKDLVDLGFFYSGYSDCARCFYCGLGLKYWRPNDDPAYQHARFRPKCLYNKLLKGQEFIDRVQQEISQGAAPSGNAARGDPKSSFDKSSAVTQAKEEGWTQEYLEEAYKKLNDSHSDAGNPRYARLLSILQEIQRERQGGAQAAPDTARASNVLGIIGHDGIDQEKIQPLDDPGRIRLAEMEHARLKDRMHCMFCKVARIGCVFLPCGHVVACQDCGDKATVCILCGKHIAALANIYLS